MPTTPIYALRYPAASDPADVPTDMQELATDVEAALQHPFYSAAASAALTLTTTQADVPGLAVTVTAAGSYLIVVTLDIVTNTQASAGVIVGQLLVGGTAQTANLVSQANTDGDRRAVTQTWLAAVTASQVVKAQCMKVGSGGSVAVQQTHSTLRAVRVAI